MPSSEEHKKGCDGTCETVMVKMGDAMVRINKEDFDPKKHHAVEEKHEEEKPHTGGRVVEATGSSQGRAKG